MFSAGLTLFAITLGLFDREPPGQAFPWRKALLLGLAAALASLGHGGVAFTLLPFGLLLLLPRWYPGWSRLVLAGAVYLGLLYPWSLYQQHYDPPGTKLLKLHLAGNTKEADSDTWQDARPLWQNVLAAYRELTPRQILDNKFANLKVLFVAAPDQYPWPPNETPPSWPVGATGYRRCDFLALFWSLGLLNLGWIAAVGKWRTVPRLNRILGVTVPALALVSVLVWVLLLFGPGGTVVHQGSYATFLLLFAFLSARLSTLPGRWPYVLLAAQAVLFMAGWLLTSPANDFGLVNVSMVAFAATFLVALARVATGDAPGAPPQPRKQGLAA
jgi:hypothetical protein